MKLLVFGDLNGQTKWLRRLLKQSEKEAIDQYVCHGDITRKISHFDPNSTKQCVGLLKSYNVNCLIGNHEEDLLSSEVPVEDEISSFFEGLESQLVLDDLPNVLFTHKSPSGKFLIVPTSSEFDIMEENYPSQRIAFFGHSHMRFHHQRQNCMIKSNYFPRFNTPYDLSDGKHLINTGTTNFGLPFSFNFRPGYVVYNSDTQEMIFKEIKKD